MSPSKTLKECLEKIPEPRIEKKTEHKLIDIIMIAICAVISGAESWTEIEMFAQEKEKWLRQYLELPNGIPSHDCFRYLFIKLDAKAFEQCFLEWIKGIRKVLKQEGISIDGKKVRHSYDETNGKAAIHMVSAWATEANLVLGQTKVEDKTNEIKAIPELLEVLELKGCIVTIDAMGCQKDIARQIQEKKADYILALKGNQEELYFDVRGIFEGAEEIKYQQVRHDYKKTINKRHGRLEIRECWVIRDEEWLSLIRQKSKWESIRSIIKVSRTRTVKGETSREDQYYISSLSADAELILERIRGHWGIENKLHWVLDVSFREDLSRVRSGNSSENFAVIRHIALNLLRQEKSCKRSIKAKRLKCALSEDYLASVVFGD
jgi:predicted transposase YbfD/YdcC